MDDVEPLIRARHLQEWLENMQLEEDPWRAQFLAMVPDDMKHEIGTAARLDWLPARHHAKLADTVAAAYGPVRAHDYYRRAFARSLRGPFWSPIVRTGVRLLGLTPASFLRWAARGWESSFKHCGTMHGDLIGPLHGRLVYDDLPSVLTASDAWVESSMGSVYGVYDLVEVSGVVRLNKSRRAQGRVELDLEWTERR